MGFKTVLLLILCALGSILYAQETFVFENQSNKNKEDYKNDVIESHYLGEEIAFKMHVFKKLYTYIIEGNSGSPGDKIEIQKPVIYNAIKKLNKYYKKSIKNKTITPDEATIRLTNILNIGISIFYQNTAEFEKVLRTAKTEVEIEAVFEKVILN